MGSIVWAMPALIIWALCTSRAVLNLTDFTPDCIVYIFTEAEPEFLHYNCLSMVLLYLTVAVS